MEDFYKTMISHYEKRIADKSVPILVRADFKKTIEHFRCELGKLATINSFTFITALPC